MTAIVGEEEDGLERLREEDAASGPASKIIREIDVDEAETGLEVLLRPRKTTWASTTGIRT